MQPCLDSAADRTTKHRLVLLMVLDALLVEHFQLDCSAGLALVMRPCMMRKWGLFTLSCTE